VALPFLAIGMAFYKFIAEPATMKSLDEQGWFGVKAYKPQQGHRIRRATLAALWFLAGSGMYTAYQSGALAPANLAMPFTGYYTVVDAHDSELITPDLMPGVSGIQKGEPLGRSEYSNLLALLATDSTGQLVKVRGDRQEIPLSDGKKVLFEPGKLVRRESVTQANRLITNPDEKSYFGIYREIQFKEAVAPTVRPEGRGQVMLLPSLGTQALVFTVLLVWLSVRLTQVPAFADFLISTDAEMNKVSWASRSKLWQDTIVVIVGMLLMAGLMMGLDQMWRGVLTATSVLQFRSGGDERNRSVEQRTW
jgi:preprotein translocase SecE subunit